MMNFTNKFSIGCISIFMERKGIIKGGILGVIGVLLGAFGAHALKEVLSPDQLISFNTGVRYQMIHALAILILVLVYAKWPLKQFKIAVMLIFIGVILFSGSIYLLNLRELLSMEWLKFLGPVTPIGGTLIITGWLMVVAGGLKLSKHRA